MKFETNTTGCPTIAVTGAAGFIGSRVVDRIQAVHPEWNLIALDNFYRGSIRRIGDVDVQHVDIRNRDRLEATLDGANIVMHLAAISGVDGCDTNRDLAYNVNVQGTANVVWYCRKAGAGLVFPYSMAVLGDPTTTPITVNLPRNPLNWYGRTKLISEHTIEDMVTDAFPAHLYLKSNIYGEHEIKGKTISKETVINFFVNRVFSDQPLTVYEPGTQSRNYIHVKDVVRAYLRSGEILLEQLSSGETGVHQYEIASNEDPSVMEVAELVAKIALEEEGIEKEVALVENPRSSETLVPDFKVDTSKAHEELGWEIRHTVEESVRELIRKKA
ncbi:NAD-dependent epimerase/dehydratase family protein [Halocatena pleomorpha]|uniref:NAD(P)-dependent oxidoreductase n=1 Tax=Halocatena pleomorpha TaxID=1785090 RepID=A0A3P3R7T0_9EURY|nr:NAD(P)-dependent oxidoreductase [Halocatena pleomorpha]RRJ29487.1 NAD(P)-dependent oxidoreductase [Halocatena pleomorpha]